MISSRPSFGWGLTIQEGPWKDTPNDVKNRKRQFNIGGGGVPQGGTLHAGNGYWKSRTDAKDNYSEIPPAPQPSSYAQRSVLIPGPETKSYFARPSYDNRQQIGKQVHRGEGLGTRQSLTKRNEEPGEEKQLGKGSSLTVQNQPDVGGEGRITNEMPDFATPQTELRAASEYGAAPPELQQLESAEITHAAAIPPPLDEEEQQELDQTISAIQEDVDMHIANGTQEQAKNELQTRRASLDKELNEMRLVIRHQADEHITLTARHAAVTSELTTAINQLRSKEQSVEQTLQSQSTLNRELQAKVSELEAEKSMLEADVESQFNVLQHLSKAVVKHKSQKDELQSVLSAITNTKTTGKRQRENEGTTFKKRSKQDHTLGGFDYDQLFEELLRRHREYLHTKSTFSNPSLKSRKTKNIMPSQNSALTSQFNVHVDRPMPIDLPFESSSSNRGFEVSRPLNSPSLHTLRLPAAETNNQISLRPVLPLPVKPPSTRKR